MHSKNFYVILVVHFCSLIIVKECVKSEDSAKCEILGKIITNGKVHKKK